MKRKYSYGLTPELFWIQVELVGINGFTFTMLWLGELGFLCALSVSHRACSNYKITK
jgi:hypothetical protein